MANEDKRLNVTLDVKSGDMSGLQSLRSEVNGLTADINKQLAEAGAYFDPITKKFKSIADEAKAGTEAVTTLNATGAELPKWLDIGRFQAAALSRELINGQINARTLGVSLASFGPAVSVGAIAVLSLIEYINNALTADEKLNEEFAKANEALATSAEHWERIANLVTTQSQLASLTDQMSGKLDEVNTKLSELALKDSELSGLHRGLVTIWESIGQIGTAEKETSDTFATGTDKQFAAQEELRKKLLAVMTQQIQNARAHEDETIALAHTKEQIDFLINAMIALEDQQEKVDTSTISGMRLFLQMQDQLKSLEDQINKTSKAMKELDDQTRKLDEDVQKQVREGNELLQKQQDLREKINAEAQVGNAAGDEELTIQAKVNKVWQETYNEAQKLKLSQEESTRLANIAADAERNKLEVLRGQSTQQSGLNELLRQANTVIQGIRQQQELTKQNPFIGVDAQQMQLLGQYRNELQAVLEAITALKAKMASGILDTDEMARANEELQKLVFNAKLLGLEIQKTTQPLRTELAQWVNSFGSAAQQLGKVIEGSINAALQGTNQLLLDAVFRTGDWRQTLMGVERQILNLFLTFIEQLALQRIAALLGITTVTSAKVASGAAIATANAPAAAASSIATDGFSAVEGEATALAAIAAIEGALVAHEGGEIKRQRRMHTGGLAHDEVPIIGQEGEVMIQRSVAQLPGMTEFLLALNSGLLFHNGGEVAAWRERAFSRTGRGRNLMRHAFRAMSARGFSRDNFDPNIDDPRSFGGTPSWYTPSRGDPNLYGPWPGTSGPFDPSIEPTPIPEPPMGNPSTIASGRDDSPSDFGPISYDPWARMGYAAPGMPWSPTIIPTTYDPYGYPYAVPVVSVTNPTDPTGLLHAGQQLHSRHAGGIISKYHVGGAIARMHSGGSVGSIGNLLRGGTHIYAFTDMRELIRHMGSREGQKIIFDTIKGRRIDLGLG